MPVFIYCKYSYAEMTKKISVQLHLYDENVARLYRHAKAEA